MKVGGEIDVMEQISIFISEQFVIHALISEDVKKEYAYAIEVLLEKGLTYSFLLAIAIYFQVLIPTLFLMGFFFSLRKYTGGFHLAHYRSCFLCTVGLYVFLVKFVAGFLCAHKEAVCVIFIISIIYLLIVGSINHPAMSWNREEFKEAKRSARYLVLIEMSIILIERYLYMNITCIIYSMMGMELCAVLLFLSKILHQEVEKRESINKKSSIGNDS